MFRTLSKSKIGFVLAVLFGISLFFIGGQTRDSNLFNSDTVVASVSGTPVNTSKFNRTMQSNVNKFNQVFGKELSGDEIRSFNIHNLALNALITEAAFENEYDKINFKLDKKVIAQKTKERIPRLYDANNKLNETYLQSLNQQQIKLEDIVQIINFETRDNYFKEAFFKVDYPSAFSKRINNFKNHKRNISYYNFDIENISIKDDVNGDTPDSNIIELEKFYNNNKSNYMVQEKRDVEFIEINKESFKDNFIPSAFEIEEYYNDNKQNFFENEKRSFLQFNFKDKNEAITFNDIIKDNTNNEVIEYASKNNIRFNNFENLGFDEILDDLSKPLFELEINQKSKVIETSLASHILILQSIKKSNQLKLEKVKNEIISTIVDIDSNNFYLDLTDKISSKILDGEKIDKIANDFNLKIKKINNLTLNFQDTKEVKQIILSDLIEKSFSSNKDFISDIVNINDNISYIYNVTNIKKSEPITLDNIKDKVFLDWKYFKRSEKIDLETKKNENKYIYFENLSKEHNSEIKKIIVSNDNKDLPFDLVKNIFEYDINKNFQYINNSKVFIVRIDNIIIQDLPEISDPIPLENNLKSTFSKLLMKNKKIKLNEALIGALIERY